MSRRLSILLLLLVSCMLLLVRSARADDDQATAIALGIESFVDVLGSLSTFEALGETIPLTDISPGAEQALHLEQIFEDTL